MADVVCQIRRAGDFRDTVPAVADGVVSYLRKSFREIQTGLIEAIGGTFVLCKLCLTESEQGVKAHIVPEAFFRFARGSDNTLATVSTDGGQYVKRSPVGPYDTNLVCRSCERLFGPWDDYAAKFLLQQIETQRKPVPGRRGTLLGYHYSPFDYANLRLFALSLLWRAAASGLAHFAQVKPGKDRVEKLRTMLLSGDPGTPDVFACYYGRWIFPRETPEFAMLHMNPAYGKVAGLGRVRFYLGPTFLDVKVDVRPWSRALNSLVMRPGPSLLMPAFEFKESFEFRECIVPAMALNNDRLTRLFGGDPEGSSPGRPTRLRNRARCARIALGGERDGASSSPPEPC